MSNLLSNDIKKILTIDCDTKYVFLFIGNTLRSDDGIAPYIADNLSCKAKNIMLLNAEDKFEIYIDDIVKMNPDITIIFDAANFNGAIGEIKIIPEEYVTNYTLSTHTFPLTIISELLKHDTNSKVYFIGIQTKTVQLGENISNEVKSAGDEIIKFLNKEFKKCMN